MFKSLRKILYTVLNIQSANRGFTLTELLVTFTLMATIVGIGFASFVSYSRRQTAIQAAADFKQTIDIARFNALSHVKPEVCGARDRLSSYKINVCFNAICQTSGVSYEMTVTCGGIERAQTTKILPQNISFSNVPDSPRCGTITINTVSGSLTGTPCEIFLVGYGNQIKVSVGASGYVTY
jgi:prepilin-type N-terminal cleavage/methylation domain-containing protein